MTRRIGFAWVLAASSCWLACSRSETAPRPDASAVAPQPAASAPSAAPPRPGGFAALRARFPDEPPWPSGKGPACGAAACGAGEFCCEESSAPRCMPKGRERGCMKTGMVAFCDESSDCAATERCCSGATDDGTLVACVSEKRCATYWDRPGGKMIPAKEICARGGSCKGTSTVCVPAPRASSVSGGQCVSSKARVACESKADCPDDKPWCFWDAAAKTGECIPRGPWLREEGVLECDDHADCPGGSCCGGGAALTFCSPAECDPGLAYAPLMCKTAKDCGQNTGNPRAVASCDPDDHLPNGLGTCGWSQP